MACIKQVAVVNPKGDESPLDPEQSDPEQSEHNEDADREHDLDDVEASLNEGCRSHKSCEFFTA